MSSVEKDRPCPKCGEAMACYFEIKPHDMVFGECLSCGFYYCSHDGQRSLQAINDERKASGLQPLKKLKKQSV